MNHPLRLTARHLTNAAACPEQVKLFRRTFPTGAPLDARSLRKAQTAGLNIFWVTRLLDAPADIEYATRRVAVFAEYDTVCAAAFVEYNTGCAAAFAAALDDHDDLGAAGYVEYAKARSAALAEYDTVCAAAFVEYNTGCAAALLVGLRATFRRAAAEVKP